jgi:hypothetical protein
MQLYRTHAEARREAESRNRIVSRETGVRYVVVPAYGRDGGWFVVEEIV